MAQAFDSNLTKLEEYLTDRVKPELAKMPTTEHKKYYALLFATQLGAGAAGTEMTCEAKLRLHHEIAERIAQLF